MANFVSIFPAYFVLGLCALALASCPQVPMGERSIDLSRASRLLNRAAILHWVSLGLLFFGPMLLPIPYGVCRFDHPVDLLSFAFHASCLLLYGLAQLALFAACLQLLEHGRELLLPPVLAGWVTVAAVLCGMILILPGLILPLEILQDLSFRL